MVEHQSGGTSNDALSQEPDDAVSNRTVFHADASLDGALD
ncbi:cytidine/deoxycytidylate deaminase family domainprotein [Synechococcus sp. MVIR-18-1]|nr:cytidine/deoxycytidylate deaminase family domainprotein [Synechococcus sp. MVIR-18-1]